jgi:magnesium chelatase subunit I
MPTPAPSRSSELPRTLAALRASGWQSRTVKQELQANLTTALARNEDLFPGIVGYESTVIPEIVNAILAGHDMLFLGEKGQAKSRLMRLLARFLDPEIPCLDMSSVVGGSPVHEDPFRPITTAGRAFLQHHGENAPIAWWPRADRYAERLAPGTKFADIIGEIDPAMLAAGTSMSAESALHFGLIPRMHRGIFAMNELPDLDDLVQVGLFNILEERDVQIRGHPIKFDLDILILFSANPTTYNRSGKVIPQLKDRIGSTIQTHYPRERDAGIEITEREVLGPAPRGIGVSADASPSPSSSPHSSLSAQHSDTAPGSGQYLSLAGPYPITIPRFMKELVEQVAITARKSKYVDHASGVSARLSIALYRLMIASARQRSIRLSEKPAAPRISDLSHFHAAALGKLELDMMGTHQMSEHQVLDAILAEAVKDVFEEYVDKHGLGEIAEIFAKGVKIEVGDMLPSAHYADRVKRVPPIWSKAFEVNAAEDPAVRASCIEFVLAGLYATDRISRSQRHGRIQYET